MPSVSPSPLPSEPLLYEVELSDFAEPDASMLFKMLSSHGQQVVRADGRLRMRCSARALRLLLEIHEDGALPCHMVYRKSRAHVTT